MRVQLIEIGGGETGATVMRLGRVGEAGQQSECRTLRHLGKGDIHRRLSGQAPPIRNVAGGHLADIHGESGCDAGSVPQVGGGYRPADAPADGGHIAGQARCSTPNVQTLSCEAFGMVYVPLMMSGKPTRRHFTTLKRNSI